MPEPLLSRGHGLPAPEHFPVAEVAKWQTH